MKQNINEWIDQAKDGLIALNVEEIVKSGVLACRSDSLSPLVNYPPISAYCDMDEAEMFQGFENRPSRSAVAYLYLPFRPALREYGHNIAQLQNRDLDVDTYINYLVLEMVMRKVRLGVDQIPVSSVLWNRGAIVIPNPRQLESLLRSFVRHYDISQSTQFSVEADPISLLDVDGLQRLQLLKEYAVDHIRLKIDAVDDRVLSRLSCAHSHSQTLQAIENIRSVGFDNIYIDLVYDYPGQTPEAWVADLMRAATMDIDGFHFSQSCSSPSGKHEALSSVDDVFLIMYLRGLITECYGYSEHQRHVFSKKENTSSHYLRDRTHNLYDVAAVGASSCSTLRGVFAINVEENNLQKYYQYLDGGRMAITRGKVLDCDDMARRSLLLPLKHSYVDKVQYEVQNEEEANVRFANELRKLKQLGMLEEDNSRIWLTKCGGLFADEVATQFYNPQYVVHRKTPNTLCSRKDSVET
ncbi:MAG: radical SAM protein [Thiohalomonadales bacterium]